MSDKFLNTGGGATNLTNGTTNIYVATLASANLEPSRPIKTNAVRELVSQNLDISDVINLQSELNTKNELMFTEDDTHTNPPANTVKIYAKTDGLFYKKDSAGVETGFAGGSNKTQNINEVGTSDKQTLFDKGDIVLGNQASNSSYNKDYTANTLTNQSGESTGYSFEIPTDIRITSIFVKVVNWASALSTRPVSIWRMDNDGTSEGSNTKIYTIYINKDNPSGGYYYTSVKPTFTTSNYLTAGKYKMSIWDDGNSQIEDGSNPFVSNTFFTSFQPQYSSVSSPGTAELPTINSVSFVGGFDFDIIQTVDTGTIISTDKLMCNESKLGMYQNKIFLNEDMSGVSLIDNPILSSAIYSQNFGIILGSAAGPAIGTVKYNFWDLFQQNERYIIDQEIGLVMEWDVDGNIFGTIISLSGTGYNLLYLHRPVAGTSQFILSVAGLQLDTQNVELLHSNVNSNNLENIILRIDISIQKISVIQNGLELYTYTDTVPRILSEGSITIYGGSLTTNKITLIKSIKFRYSETTPSLDISSTFIVSNANIYCKKALNCDQFLEIGGTSFQRPFTVLNGAYGKSLEIERQAFGMGINFNSGVSSVGYINSVGDNIGITATGNINLSTGLLNTVTGVPYVLSFACSDEGTPIAISGIKASLISPINFDLKEVRTSLSFLPGASFAFEIRKNGVPFISLSTGDVLKTTTVDTTSFLAGDDIQFLITNLGDSTGTALKCYLIGKTTI